MITDLVSIIIPIYNAEPYLSKCLDSVLSQTYKNLEILLVNDGSTDASVRICEKYAAKDKRIKLIHQKNKGPSVARNNGIKNSIGKYLQFIDADDKVSPMMVYKLVNALKYDDVDLALCGNKHLTIREGQTQKKVNLPKAHKSLSIDDFLKKFPKLFKRNLINSPCNKLYCGKIIRNNKIIFPVGMNNGEDLLFNIQYLNYCRKISLVNEPLYIYNRVNNPTSLTKKYQPNYFDNRKKVFNELQDFIMKKSPRSVEHQKMLYQIFKRYLLQCFSNIFKNAANLSSAEIKMEINRIIHDKWVHDNLSAWEKEYNNKQEKLIFFFVKRKSTNGLYFFFQIKEYLRIHFNQFFQVLKSKN